MAHFALSRVALIFFVIDQYDVHNSGFIERTRRAPHIAKSNTRKTSKSLGQQNRKNKTITKDCNMNTDSAKETLTKNRTCKYTDDKTARHIGLGRNIKDVF